MDRRLHTKLVLSPKYGLVAASSQGRDPSLRPGIAVYLFGAEPTCLCVARLPARSAQAGRQVKAKEEQ